MAEDSSLQFKEPSHPHPTLHSSTSTSSDTSTSSTTTSPPPMERQSSVSKIAGLAKHLVKSPQEEKEHLQLEKTLDREVKKGPQADIETMEA